MKICIWIRFEINLIYGNGKNCFLQGISNNNNNKWLHHVLRQIYVRWKIATALNKIKKEVQTV